MRAFKAAEFSGGYKRGEVFPRSLQAPGPTERNMGGEKKEEQGKIFLAVS